MVMKRVFKQITVFLFSTLLLTACFNDDGYSLDKYWIDIATVENPQERSEFFLRLDDSVLLWTAASNFSYYKPNDGQRVIANYTILSDKRGTGMYDYDIKLNNVYEVLTKGIFEITPEKQDSIGNDPVRVTEMWIGSKFLNVEFYYFGHSKIHFINLVSDTAKTYTDEKIHLEFRHNANNDPELYKRWGIVSFDISSLQTNAADSVNLVIHVNKPNQEEDELFELTYHYNNSTSAGIKRKSNMNNFDSYIPDNEVK